MEKNYIKPTIEVLPIAAELPVAATQMRKGGGSPITESSSILGKQRGDAGEEVTSASDGWDGWL